MKLVGILCVFILTVVLVWGVSHHADHASESQKAKNVIRVGFFPNITHAHALIAQSMARRGDDWFQKRLGADVQVEWRVYHAGPSAMEAMLAHSLDVSYVGPNPALNAYMRSQGREIRCLAGAVEGGTALVVQKHIRNAHDLHHQRIATPQLGNTQDVACRLWLKGQGFKVSLTGGDCEVLPIANPDQLGLFSQNILAGAWTVEPWVSRLVCEAGGKILVEQSDAITTILVADQRFVQQKQEWARAFTQAHIELTEWIQQHPEEAQTLLTEQFMLLTRGKMEPALIQEAWKRLRFDAHLSVQAMQNIVTDAQNIGFLKGAATLDHFFVDFAHVFKHPEQP